MWEHSNEELFHTYYFIIPNHYLDILVYDKIDGSTKNWMQDFSIILNDDLKSVEWSLQPFVFPNVPRVKSHQDYENSAIYVW